MIALEPGLYRATVRGVADQIVLLTATAPPDPWFAFEPQSSGPSSRWFRHADITDARPLIVIDLSGVNVLAFTDDLRGGLGGTVACNVADQIIEQTKPARIKEPGLWGVVEATFLNQRTRQPFLRDNIKENVGGGWVAIYGPPGTDKRRVDWDSLIDPTLIREGLS